MTTSETSPQLSGAAPTASASTEPLVRRHPIEGLRLPRQPLVRHTLLGIIGLALVVLVTFNENATSNYSLALAGCYAAAIAGLSVLTGVSGQISLGNGAFMAMGSYAATLWLIHFPTQSFLIPLAVGTAVGAVTGIVVGVPATRLRGPYLAGMTIAFAGALPLVLQNPNWTSWLGGDSGLAIVNQPAPPPWLLRHSQTPGLNSYAIAQNRYLAWIAAIGAIIVLIVLANLLSSRFGRQFRAIRDDDVAAELMGIHVARTRVIAFGTSAASAGLGGALLAVVLGAVSPTNFEITLSVSLLAAMVIGGSGTLMGAVWGGLILGFQDTWTGRLSNVLGINPTSNVGANLQVLVYGVLLIVLIMLAPGGIQRFLSRAWQLVYGAWLKRVKKIPTPT